MIFAPLVSTMGVQKKWFIREKVERVIRLIGFPPETCGNDEEKQPLKVVILGLDPGIQGVFNLNTKDTKKLVSIFLNPSLAKRD